MPRESRGGKSRWRREGRKEVSASCLEEGRRRKSVEQKEVETQGGEGGGWLKTTFSACTSGPSPQRPFATSRHSATPCAGLKLKSEHCPPLTVRTCFLGGLSAESKDEESWSRGSADSWLHHKSSTSEGKHPGKPRRDWQQLGDLLTLLLSTDSPALPGV